VARQEHTPVPAGGALGTGATDFFCEAVAAGSNAIRRMAENPLPIVAALVALVGSAEPGEEWIWCYVDETAFIVTD